MNAKNVLKYRFEFFTIRPALADALADAAVGIWWPIKMVSYFKTPTISNQAFSCSAFFQCYEYKTRKE